MFGVTEESCSGEESKVVLLFSMLELMYVSYIIVQTEFRLHNGI